MSVIAYSWLATKPPRPDVYVTRRNSSRYQTMRYWDGRRWWQIEWCRTRASQAFKWPKGSRTRFPSSMARYRDTLGLRRINDPFQGAIQWGAPYRVYDDKEVLSYLVNTGRLHADWRKVYQIEMRAKLGDA